MAIKVAICTPSLDGKVQDEYSHSLSRTIVACANDKRVSLLFAACRGITLIHEARNYLAAHALHSGAEKVFFIDADMAWRAEDFIRLAVSDEPMIGGIYQQRARQWNAPIGMVAQYEDIPPVIDADGLVRMKGLGTGFLCIKREVFEKLATPDVAPLYFPKLEAVKDGPGADVWNHYRAWFDFSWNMFPREDLNPEIEAVLQRIGYREEEEGWLRLLCGEDFTFIRKAKEAGYRLVADPDCRLTHYDGCVAHPVAFRDIKWSESKLVVA